MIEQTLVFKTFRKVIACSLMDINIHSVFVDFDIANILLLIHIDQDEGKHVFFLFLNHCTKLYNVVSIYMSITKS